MSVFGNYARYYDLLYRDKDYIVETEFIHQLINAYAPDAKTILELGCGTGIHASLLTKRGYKVCAVDLSETMLEQARYRAQQLYHSSAIEFVQGDIRTVRVERSFDVVISLFHVFSYQITNADLQAAFATAKDHLNPGGLLIFDCWYGPAVLSDRPTVRVKRLEDDAISVTRIAEPKMHFNQNRVDVNYQILIRDRATGAVEELYEVHPMRYLFTPEVELLLDQFQFDSVTSGEWWTQSEPGAESWGVYFVGSRAG
ncbi:MAG: SAM-dependent methyltransferase [Leptolyngbya sp. ERB_1_1]